MQTNEFDFVFTFRLLPIVAFLHKKQKMNILHTYFLWVEFAGTNTQKIK
jgi:hypothetical protein